MVKRSERATVPLLLTFNAGFVDMAGFLAIAGLFTAHVTGNFVTVGAALVAGSAGVLSMHLSAFPCTTLMTGTTTQVVIALTDILAGRWNPATRARAAAMGHQVAVLAAGCAVATLLFDQIGALCFLPPPLVAATALAVLPAGSEA